MSAWVMGPDRGLDTLVLDDVPAPQHATFEPDMMSNPLLRDTVVSSGYGAHVPAPRVVAKVEDPDETFDPALVSTKDGEKMREIVPSSGYGRGKIPDHRAKAKQLRSERKLPSFQPVINRTTYGKKVYKQVNASKYGRKVPVVSVPAPGKLKHKYKPALKSDPDMRANVPSSGYGSYDGYAKESVDPIAITNRARRRSVEGFGSVSSPFESLDTDPNKPTVVSKPVSMYTLLSPEAQPLVRPEDEVEPEPEIPFILDAERVANHLYPRCGKLSLKYVPAVVPVVPMPASPLKEHFDSQVASHGYGSEAYYPDVAEKPEEKVPGPQWNISCDDLQQLSEEALAAEAELEAQLFREKTSKQFDHVGSTQYGQKFPTTTPKKEIPEAKTAFLAAGPARPTLPELEDAPLFNTTRLMVEVQSAGYGRISPPKAYRPEKEPTAVWVPASANPGSPAVEAPPASKYRTQVRTQYDHQYFPE